MTATPPEAQNPAMYFGPVVYVLSVELDDVEPPIWRQVVVEDCRGSSGYAELLETLADPSRPDHEHMVEWAPAGFDPAAFDVATHDAAVRKVR
ncbi:MAG: hypothetical protein AAGA17_20280 [Actinomycetota bacterium]